MESTQKSYKILIINPRDNLTNKKSYQYTFPLGLAYITSILKQNNHQVDCLNLNHYSGTIKQVITHFLNKTKYDFIGTGNNALAYNTTKIIINSIKEHPSKPKIILGGPIITTQPELYFKDLKPDFGIIGEGEETIIDLLNNLENLENVKGIIYKENSKIKITEKRNPPNNLNTLPYPDFEAFNFTEYLNNQRTNTFHNYNPFNNPRTYPILGSRSCPYQCTFCYHDSKYRARSIENIMKELRTMVKKYKINIILLYDDCFAITKERVEEFCKEITKLQKEISWKLKWSPQLTVKHVTPELLKLMKDSGCDTISYGYESYSQEVLQSMKKPITPEQIDYSFKETLKAGMAIQANFIFGDTKETKETAKETLDYWKKNAKGQISLIFIQSYPGSQIYKHCIKKGIIKDEIKYLQNLTGSTILNMTENMSNKEFNKLIKDIYETNSKYLKYIKPNSIKKTSKEIYTVNVKCPFCKKHITYKNCKIENLLSYSFNLVCRNCHMRFFVASTLRKIAIKHHSKLRKIREIQMKAKNYIKKLKLKLSN